MSLYICDNCGGVENTAMSLCSWTSEEKLCSECCPAQKKWHNKFKKTYKMPKGERDIFKEIS